MNKHILSIAFVLQFSFSNAQPASAVLKGEILGPFVWKSRIYPGTERDYWVYVPKQYDAAKPSCLMVVQDGLSRATGWNLPRVLDSLIALKQIPVMIGVFIDHGKVPSVSTDNFPRFNRSFEYDALGDRYARFLLEELIPEIGKSYNLSADPNDRSIAGASSGAICAFNVAWERPDAFRRVLSTIGTYVGIRGGDELATLVRKTEAKPLRIFLEDGDHDLNIAAGDWWMANQNMLSALTWSGYEVNHAWGEGGHDSKHAVIILAEALKWLWKDYPAAVQTHKGVSPRLNPVLENEPWKEVPLNGAKANRLAINKAGEVFFSDNQTLYKVDKTGIIPFYKLKGAIGGISFHSDDRLYISDLQNHKIVSINENHEMLDVVKNVSAEFLTVTKKGIYFSESTKERVGFYSFAKKEIQYNAIPGAPTGLAVSAEQTFLSAGVANSIFGFSLKILEDGRLDASQEYIHYHVPYGASTPGANGMTVDAENLLYSVTGMGIQVSDQLGRVNFIFSKPGDGATDIKFGGGDFMTLYVSCSGKLFSRKINSRGILSWLPPLKPSRPGL